MSTNDNDTPLRHITINPPSYMIHPGWHIQPMEPAKCGHHRVQPTFDPGLARDKSFLEVRQLWPRFMGSCPDCGELVILYASFEHYLAGDW